MVDYLHSQGIIHRDLKPQNILTKSINLPDSELRLIDFGLGVRKGSGKHEEGVCGTPGFIAPEVFTPGAADFKSDVFSIGVMFYIMLTGESPFGVGDRGERLKRNRVGVIDYAKLGKCGKKARRLIEGMLERDPGKRLSARECLESEFLKVAEGDEIYTEEMEEGVEGNMRKFNGYQANSNMCSPFQSPGVSPKAGTARRFFGFGLKRLENELDDVLEQAKELRLFGEKKN